MSTEQTLARIDDTLEDWGRWDGHSPDAARWAGGPTEGEWPAEEPPPGLQAMMPVAVVVQAPADSLARAMVELSKQLSEIVRQVEADTGKSWAYLVQRAARPLAAAERTSSARRRAGSRRTKRNARRQG